jgi:hypothetical protein
MKSKNVHRGVSNLPAAEQQSNAPVLGVGKLSRIHRNYARERKHRSRKDKGVLFREYLKYVFLFFAIVLISGVTWILYQQINRNKDVAEVTSLTEDTFIVPHPSASECIDLVKRFLDTGSPTELARTGRLKRFDKEQGYLAFTEVSKQSGEVERLDWAGAEETNGLSLEMVLVTYKTGKYRIAFLTHDERGNWKVDVESFLAHNTRPWDQVIGKGSCRAIVRVMATPDSYYNGIFQNEKEWGCLALTSPDHSERIYGYLKPKSPAILAVTEMLRTKNPAVMFVEISRDAGMDPMQYEIKKVIAQGWVESDVEFSSRFERGALDSTETQ